MLENCNLKVEWCSHDAANYACTHWHYSGCLPCGKLAKVGIWENEIYIGCVVFGRGASPYLEKAYGLAKIECIELVRIALNNHINTVTKIVSLAIKKIKKSMPKIRLIVSFADPEQQHLGIIYQAGNWIYTGRSAITNMWNIKGQRMHQRSVGAKYGTCNVEALKKKFPKLTVYRAEGKYRYLMPLDKKMRKEIIKISLPYPHREKRGRQ